MGQDLITHQENQPMFVRNQQLAAQSNAGSVAIEQERAIAEAQGQLVLAKKFPRDENAAFADLMRACKMPSFASVAFYNVPRGKGSVIGPSIRLAEEIARCYGNFEYGHRELSRDSHKSEVEVYAWDKEKNNRSIRQVTVNHVMDTKDGARPLRDQKDIDDRIANVASKQVRGRILALMPKWLVEEAIQECRKTLAGKNDEPIEARVRRIIQAFAKFGVTTSHIERHLGHSLAEVTIDEIPDLQGIFNAIKDGTPASEFFAAEIQAEQTEQDVAALQATAQAAKAAQTAGNKRAPKAAPAPAERPAPTPAPAAAQEVSNPAEKVSNPAEEESPQVTGRQEAAPAQTEVHSAAGGAETEEDDVF